MLGIIFCAAVDCKRGLVGSITPPLNTFAAASDQVVATSDDYETSNLEDEIYDPLEKINRAILSYQVLT